MQKRIFINPHSSTEDVKLAVEDLYKKDCAITSLAKYFAKKEMGIADNDPNYESKVKIILEKFIVRECVENNVPWKVFVEGSYRPQKGSNKILYHSHFLPQLYRHYATIMGLPLQTNWRIKYKINTSASSDLMFLSRFECGGADSGGTESQPCPSPESIQSVFRKIALMQIGLIDKDEAGVWGRELYDKFQSKSPKIKLITIPKRDVVGFPDETEGLVYALSGCYDIVGASGYMDFKHGEIEDRFYFDYSLDTEKTKLKTTTGYGDKVSPYGEYPQRIIATKWIRACVEAYYRPKLIGVQLPTEDEEDISKESAAESSRLEALIGAGHSS